VFEQEPNINSSKFGQQYSQKRRPGENFPKVKREIK